MQVLKAGKVLHLAEGAVHASKFADAALSDAMRSAESPVQERRVVQLVPGPRYAFSSARCVRMKLSRRSARFGTFSCWSTTHRVLC
jgi:hypothetical protein